MFQPLMVRLGLTKGWSSAVLVQAEVYTSAGIYTMWAHIHASMGMGNKKSSSL
jgi:hypothetical protein